jgi:hypothetical protein
MATFHKTLQLSVGSAILFMVVHLPQTYKRTSKIFPWKTISNRCPTHLGILFHTLVFFLLTFFSMGNVKIQTGIKLKHSLYGTLIYFLLSNPATYYFVSNLLGTQFANNKGCPSVIGVLLHSVIYCMFLLAVMYLP